MTSVTEVIEAYRAKDFPGFLFFWGHHSSADGRITKSCLSQWYECSFTVDGVTYHTAEQYMMAQKAKLFRDEDIFQKIMSASDPKEYKRLGRCVRDYDDSVWAANRVAIVTMGNIHKFRQNEQLARFLRQTGNKILVEASPYDCVWGIGLSADTPSIYDPTTWRGTNLLGFSLMAVRDEIV